MDKSQKSQLTIVEAVDILAEFKQKLVDENYEQLVEGGECETLINFETLEAIEVLLYFLSTLDQKEEEL